MPDFKSGFNPFSSENLTMFLYVLVIMGTLLVIVISIEQFLIPNLNPENRFAKWWVKHIFSFNPFEKN
jgi:hypothetical protein